MSKVAIFDFYRVPGVDTQLVGVLDKGQRFLLIEDPILPFLGAIAHGT